MPVQVTCLQCKCTKSVIPARAQTFKFCSYACKGEWRKANWTGENNPKWTGGVREKNCQHCGKLFKCDRRRAISLFEQQKFCSKACADVGGFRYTGNENTKWKDGPVKRSGTSQQRFRKLVLQRDGKVCRQCGSSDNLHAHHVLPFKDAPALRWDIDNGITLCFQCHSNLHQLKIG